MAIQMAIFADNSGWSSGDAFQAPTVGYIFVRRDSFSPPSPDRSVRPPPPPRWKPRKIFFFLYLSEVTNGRKLYIPPREVHVQVKHSMPPQKLEIFKSLEGWADETFLTYLKPVEKSWQPTDFLPEPESEGFYDQVKELRERCKELPDEYFVVLVGDMITEEALPTYQTMLNTLMHL